MWDDGAGRVDIVSSSAERDDAVVLANTVLTYQS
jgi:hypothetical protein